jgi:hypothetical protein
MADDLTPKAWMCLACSYAENSLDCLRCSQRRRHDGDVPTTMATATARWAVAQWDTMMTTMATDDDNDNADDGATTTTMTTTMTTTTTMVTA